MYAVCRPICSVRTNMMETFAFELMFMRSLVLATTRIIGCWDNILIHLCCCVSYAINKIVI